MGGLLVALGAFTLHTIRAVGVDRVEAMRIEQRLAEQLDGSEDDFTLVEVPAAAVSQSFVLLGVLLALSGAVAFGVAASEVHIGTTRLALARRRRLLRRDLPRAQRDVHSARDRTRRASNPGWDRPRTAAGNPFEVGFHT